MNVVVVVHLSLMYHYGRREVCVVMYSTSQMYSDVQKSNHAFQRFNRRNIGELHRS